MINHIPHSNCRWAPAHAGIVVYTRRARDLWQKRYWVRCTSCALRLGPYYYREEAEDIRRDYDLMSLKRAGLSV